MRVVSALLRLLVVVVVAGVGTAAIGVAVTPQLAKIVTAHESTSSLPPLRPLTRQSYMYDAYGNLMGELKAEVDRRPVKLAQIPVAVRDAVIAVEDEGFYQHSGVSLRSLVRATLLNVSAGGVVQGGSTITQQVVKKNLLTDTQTADRKMKEAMYARRLEERYTKDEILELYLNTVYFGNGAYGVQAAAQVYWGKNVEELNLIDGALLAGMIRNPEAYNPFRFPDRTDARRRVALERLVDTGRMTSEEMEAAAATPLPSARQPRADIPPETYFFEEVKRQLLDGVGAGVLLGDTSEKRYDSLFYGGLRIFTSYDPVLQSYAEAARESNLPPPESRGDNDVAIAVVEPGTGAVKALVGGPGLGSWQYNLATQGQRQPGSSFKTFVLLAALEAGVLPEDLIDGTDPCEFPNPGGEPDPYVVNAVSGGVGDLSSMTARSINCAYVRLGQAVGIGRVNAIAQRLGIGSTDLKDVPSAPLGTNIVTTLDMASAYGVIANNGMKHDTHLVTRIESDSGEVLYDRGTPAGSQVLAPEVAQRATVALSGVLAPGGTASRAPLAGARPAAGKTGTSQDNGDAWFVGYTPQYSVAVWLGHKADRFTIDVPGFQRGVTGGTIPAQIWKAFMDQALAAQPVVGFTPPPPSPRPPVRIILPGVECSSEIPRQPFWTMKEETGARGRKYLHYVPPTDPAAWVPAVPADASVYNCSDGPPRRTTTSTTQPRSGGTGTNRTQTTRATSPPATPPPADDGTGGGDTGGADTGGGDTGGGDTGGDTGGGDAGGGDAGGGGG